MIRKIFVVAALIVMLLSACGKQAPVETATPTATETPIIPETGAETATEAPVASETPVIVPTDTIIPPDTPAPAVPTNASGCTNSASFTADVTIPDKSDIDPGATFTKTWRVTNTGTCVWGPDYTLTYYSEERMGSPASVRLGVTLPGQTLDISMNLIAPSTQGLHRANFVIKNPAGLIMKIDKDSRLWVIVNVTGTVASTATATANAAVPTSSNAGSVTSTSTGSGTSTGPSSTAAGPGFANVTCAYADDQTKAIEAINAINAYRASQGIPAYTVNTQLTQAALAHAHDMACNNLFGHKGSNASTPQSRVAASGYVASSVTENVYGSYPPLTGAGAVDWWKNDKTDLNHNKNLLSTKYTEIGVAYSFYNNFGYYVVDFATP